MVSSSVELSSDCIVLGLELSTRGGTDGTSYCCETFETVGFVLNSSVNRQLEFNKRRSVKETVCIYCMVNMTGLT